MISLVATDEPRTIYFAPWYTEPRDSNDPRWRQPPGYPIGKTREQRTALEAVTYNGGRPLRTLIVPPNVTLWFAPGAYLELGDDVALIIQGYIRAEATQIFLLPDVLALRTTPWQDPATVRRERAIVRLETTAIERVYPEWFGVLQEERPSSVNAAANSRALQACIHAACRDRMRGVESLPPLTVVCQGIYSINEAAKALPTANGHRTLWTNGLDDPDARALSARSPPRGSRAPPSRGRCRWVRNFGMLPSLRRGGGLRCGRTKAAPPLNVRASGTTHRHGSRPMGFFESEFVDLRPDSDGAGTRHDGSLDPDPIRARGRCHPNGLTRCMAPGRSILRRAKKSDGGWHVEFAPAQRHDPWMGDAAELGSGSASVHVRGEIIASRSRIFLRQRDAEGASPPPSFAPTHRMVFIESKLPRVSRGRSESRGCRAVPRSPGDNPGPCFTCVGNHLENGVEVYFGAPRCALVANHTRTGSPARLTHARPGIRAVTSIFGLATLLAMVFGGTGCTNSASNTDAGPRPTPEDIAHDVIGLDAGARQDRSAGMDGEMDAGQAPASDVPVTGTDLPPDRPPLDVPGALPIDGYPPPSQQRHRCPVSTEGDPGIPAPRLVGPMSPLRMTSQRPTLRWELAPGLTGAQIDLCRDPCCQQVITTLQAIGDHARPVRPLAQGVVFWRTRGMVGSRIGRDHSFTWEFGVPHRDSTIDTFKGSIHDFNGDGFDDVVVAIARHARVYWGGVGGLTEERYTDYRLTDYDQSPRLTVGDVNADGFADVIAMQSYINPSTSVNYMRIEVLHGSGSGLVSDSPDHIADGLQVNTGDINGDGFADGVTNRQRDLGSREVPEATVLFGGQAGLGSGGMMRVSDPRQSREPSGAFGVSSAVGDADGDGYADAILGAVNEDRFAGAVYAYRGGASGLNPSPALRIPTMIDAPRESRWGARIYCIGDINRDGLADFHVAARGETIPVFVGSRTRLLTHAYNAEIPGSSDSISIWSAAAADLDGDGDQDGYWGCTTCYGVNEDGGEIGQLGHVVLLSEGDGGPAVTTIRPPPYPANEPDRTYYFGQGVVAVDVDGDGWDDLVTINPETYDPGWWRGRGRVSVFFGGPGIWGRAVHFYVMPERSGPGAWNLA